MKNKSQQPERAKGEIKYTHNANFSDIRYAELFINGKKIAHAENGTGEFEATIKEWERIVGAVNMQDELIECIKDFYRGNTSSAFKKSEQLLKQAEQK